MSKNNKAQKAEIAARVQRIAVLRREVLHERINAVTTLHNVNDSQAVLIGQLRTEIKRLKSVDAALKDFNLDKQRAQQDELTREGFDQVIAHRQPRRHI